MPRTPRLGFTKGCADAPQNMSLLGPRSRCVVERFEQLHVGQILRSSGGALHLQ
jgi:hypothetical protein